MFAFLCIPRSGQRRRRESERGSGLCKWINDDDVCEPHHIDIDGGACREQYGQGSDDSAAPRSGGFGFASEDERAGDT